MGFFSRGVTLACLKADGKTPEEREVFITVVIAGTTAGAMACSRVVGTGSSRQVVGRLPVMSLDTSPSESGVNSDRVEPLTGADRGDRVVGLLHVVVREELSEVARPLTGGSEL